MTTSPNGTVSTASQYKEEQDIVTTTELVKANFPEELHNLEQWVVWKWEQRQGEDKPTKVPYNPKTGKKAKSDKPATWGTFEQACAALTKYKCAGLGFMFSGDDPYVGIDFDACIVDGQIDPQRWEYIRRLDSYSEYSPSGTGVHSFVRGVLPEGGRKSHKWGIEMYDSVRFFTVTGRHIEGTPSAVMNRQKPLVALHTEIFGKVQQSPIPQQPSSAIPPDDAELLARMFQSKSGSKIRRLWDGDTSTYNSDDSSADQALCNFLAFWTDKDAARIDRMFRQSGLMREKWEREDYRRRTIDKAITVTREGYKGDRKGTKQTAQTIGDPPLMPTTYTNGNGNGHHDITIEPPTPEQPHYLTDLGNGRRFARQHSHNLRYVEEWGWLCWNGRAWERDQSGAVMRLAKQTALSIFDEANACLRLAQKAQAEAKAAAEAGNMEAALEAENRVDELNKMAKKLNGWALNSQSASRLEAMVKLAKSELPIPERPESFDTKPMLLNVENGTINLRDGKLYPHRREDLLTKICPVEYEPQAKCPTWMAALYRWMDGKQHMVDFLCRLVGYSITGKVSEQILPFPFGDGSNGKSTWMNTLLAMLGKDYATQAAPELLTAGRNAHPTELADLRGMRLVASIEVDDGKRMAEGLVKQLTGGDKLKARFMRQDFFEFDPTHKIFLIANHKPVVTGTDHAIWRRILLIPFTVRITEEEKDPRLGEKLQQELPGILAWAVRGCLDWQKHGLQVPEEVKVATNEYKAESDTLARFLDECTTIVSDARIKSSKLYKAWEEWCRANGEEPRNSTWFGLELSKRGYMKDQNYQGVFYRGIGLKEMREPE